MTISSVVGLETVLRLSHAVATFTPVTTNESLTSIKKQKQNKTQARCSDWSWTGAGKSRQTAPWDSRQSVSPVFSAFLVTIPIS